MNFRPFLLVCGLLLVSCDSASKPDNLDRGGNPKGQDSLHQASVVSVPISSTRVALVLGNNRYDNLPENRQLFSPKADAIDVAKALKSLGYTLVSGGAVVDAKKEEMLTAMEAFARAAKGAEASIFYYSGHGVQVGEDNYLLPSDVPTLTGLSVLRNRAVLLRDSVMVALEESGVGNKVIILDCCRDNPFAAQLETTLAQVGKSIKTKGVGEMSGYGPGFYLAFATSPGFTANDGNGQRNSPFTAAMLKSLPGGASKDIDFFFRDVKALLGQEQVSWTNHSLRANFSLSRIATMSSGAQPDIGVPTETELERRARELAAKMVTGTPQRVSPTVNPVPSFEAASIEKKSVLDEGAVGKVVEMMLAGSEVMKFCYCPPGSFVMGSPTSEVGRGKNENQVSVRISQGYWMAQTEVTQGQWEVMMGSNPSRFNGDKNLPVENVSMGDAHVYLTKLNGLMRLPAGWKYALPTEAQWEYACRAGAGSAFAFGDGLTIKQANFGGNLPYRVGRSEHYVGKTAVVGGYEANSWGLFDMHGNVWEWCEDWYGEVLGGGVDPHGPSAGVNCVVRGGSWYSSAASCRSASRSGDDPVVRDSDQGFRPVIVLSSP